MSSRLKSVTILLVLTLFVSTGSVTGEELEIHRAYFSLGGTTFDMEPLNSRFNNKGYSEISEEFFSIGGGIWSKAADKVLVGAEGRLLVGEQKSSVIGGKDYASSAIGGYGFLNAGYLLVENDHLDLYPILGVGIGGLGVKIGRSSFDDILDDPQRAANVNTFSFLLNFALGADYKIKLPEIDNKEHFFTIGFRGGYALSVYDSGWFMDEFNLTGDPDGGISGPYMSIVFGGGPIPD